MGLAGHFGLGVFFGMRFELEILRPLKQVFLYLLLFKLSYWVRANKSSETEELVLT